MAGTKAWLCIAGWLFLVVPHAPTLAAGPALVVHVDDRAGVPPPELAAAKRIVERTFAAAGVEIGWAEGRFPASITGPLAEFAQARHLAVLLVNNDRGVHARRDRLRAGLRHPAPLRRGRLLQPRRRSVRNAAG